MTQILRPPVSVTPGGREPVIPDHRFPGVRTPGPHGLQGSWPLQMEGCVSLPPQAGETLLPSLGGDCKWPGGRWRETSPGSHAEVYGAGSFPHPTFYRTKPPGTDSLSGVTWLSRRPPSPRPGPGCLSMLLCWTQLMQDTLACSAPPPGGHSQACVLARGAAHEGCVPCSWDKSKTQREGMLAGRGESAGFPALCPGAIPCSSDGRITMQNKAEPLTACIQPCLQPISLPITENTSVWLNAPVTHALRVSYLGELSPPQSPGEDGQKGAGTGGGCLPEPGGLQELQPVPFSHPPQDHPTAKPGTTADKGRL